MKVTGLKSGKWWLLYLSSLYFVVLLASIVLIGKGASAPGTNHVNNNANNTVPIEIHGIASSPSNSSPKVVGDVNVITSLNLHLPPVHPGLSTSSEPQLRKLAEYETSAGGAIASGMMYFTRYSDSTSSAKNDAADMASTLKEFAKYGLTPLVIMEPTSSSGTLDFKNYRNGAYDNIIDTYFQTLKSLGISDSELGVWTYFPEANLPQWGPVDVADFAPNVTRTVNIQKKYFPSSRASIMLDAKSYPSGSATWSGGAYSSLAPFISGIPTGLLDSFGLQGFPWAPPANRPDEAPSYNPSIYLNASLAASAASQLGVRDIWLNTGTIAAMYTNNPGQTVNMSSDQRQGLLNGVLNQALNLNSKGFGVTVNLFCEDKSNTSLATDRSYKSASDQNVLNNFAKQLYSNNITMWLFDN